MVNLESYKDIYQYSNFKYYNILGYSLGRQDIWDILNMSKDIWYECIRRYGEDKFMDMITQMLLEIPKEELDAKYIEILEKRKLAQKDFRKKTNIKMLTINGEEKTLRQWATSLDLDDRILRYKYDQYGPNYVRDYLIGIMNGTEIYTPNKVVGVYRQKHRTKGWCKLLELPRARMIKIVREDIERAKRVIKRKMIEKYDEEIMTLPEPEAEEYFAAL